VVPFAKAAISNSGFQFMKPRFLTLLGATFALIGSVVPATAGQPFRLFEIFTERIVNDTSGTPIFDRGRLTAQGEFKHDIYAQITPGTTVPAEAMNQPLLPFAMWPAYDALGTEALANFKLDRTVTVGGQSYFVVTVSNQPKLDVGTLLNISTRGAVAPGGEPLIGGFVVQDHSRRVLLRAVGPTLSGFGVTAPLANPVLTVFRQGEKTGFVTNDDWGQQANAADIEAAAATVGAFPLPRASKDAVLLIELPPGTYTAHLGSGDATGGTALLEIYLLP
jgi:hypothetical protein